MTDARGEDWQRLLDALGTLGHVTVTDRGLLVEFEGRAIEIVVTADDWDDMPVTWGTYPIKETLDLVRTQPAELPFLVYNGQYELEPCATPAIPPSTEELRMKELMRLNPDGIPGSSWFAYKCDGTRDHLTDFEDIGED